MLANENKYQSSQGSCPVPVRFLSGYAVRVRFCVRVRVRFESRFVFGLVSGSLSGFVSGSCLVSVWVRVGFVFGACLVNIWVRVGFVFGACLIRICFIFNSYLGSYLDLCLIRI